MLFSVSVFRGFWWLLGVQQPPPPPTPQPYMPLEKPRLAGDNVAWMPLPNSPPSLLLGTPVPKPMRSACVPSIINGCAAKLFSVCVKFIFASAAPHTIVMMPGGENAELSEWA